MSAAIANEYKRRYFIAMTNTAIKRAIAIAGNQENLAKAIGVSQGLISQWINGAQIATRHFAAIENVTKVTASELLVDEMAKASWRESGRKPSEQAS